MWKIATNQDRGDDGRPRMRAADTLLDQALHLLKTHKVAVAKPEAAALLCRAQRNRGQEKELLGFRGRSVRRQLGAPSHDFGRNDGERRKSATLSAAAPAAVRRRTLGRGKSASKVQSA